MKKIILTASAITFFGFATSPAQAQGLLSALFGTSNTCPPCNAQANYRAPAVYPGVAPGSVRPTVPNYNTYHPNYGPYNTNYNYPSQNSFPTPYNHAPYTHTPQYQTRPVTTPTYNYAPVSPVSAPQRNAPFFGTNWSSW